MNVESIVYLLRKTSLSRNDIGELSPAQFNAILKEVAYQESSEEYRKQQMLATLLAAIYNTIPRKKGAKTFTVSDFLKGEPPLREGERRIEANLETLALRKGIILPKE